MLTQYNAKDCTVTINTTYVTGMGESMVSGSKDEEFFSTSVGAQGDVVVNEVNNTVGTITLTLQGGSPQKKMLLEYAKNGVMFSIWCANKTIGERFGGNSARIKNYPELANGSELEDREFEIAVFDYVVENC